MLFKKKFFSRKTTVEEKEPKPGLSWAVIISKILKPEVQDSLTAKIAETFRMTSDEAANIVNNAPIILLDDLNRQSAEKVKEYFRTTGAEIFLTDDPVDKTKFCRTVWPEDPSLTFVERPLPIWEKAAPKPDDDHSAYLPKEEEPLEQEEEEISTPDKPVTDRSFIYTEESSGEEQGEEAGETGEPEDAPVYGEGQDEALGREFEEIYDRIDKINDESQTLKDTIHQAFHRLDDEESEISNQQETLKEIEKKQQMIQDDFGRFLSEFEGQFRQYAHKVENLEAKSAKFFEGLSSLEEVKNNLHFSFYDYRKKYERFEKEYLQAQKNLESKLGESSEKLTLWKQESGELSKEIDELRDVKESMLGMFEEQKKRFSQLEDSHRLMRSLLEEKLERAAKEAEGWKNQAEVMTLKAEEIEKSRKLLEDALFEQKEKLLKMEKNYRSLQARAPAPAPAPQRNSTPPPAARKPTEWQSKEQKMIDKLEVLERMQGQVIADLHERLKKESLWESKANDLNKTIERMREEQAQMQKKLTGKLKKKKPETDGLK